MMTSLCSRYFQWLVTIVILGNATAVLAFDREEISFHTLETRNLFGAKTWFTEVVSSKLGPIASISSNQQRASIQFNFEVSDSYGGADNPSQGFEQLSRLRSQIKFSEIGSPVAAGITQFEGAFYAIVWTTSKDGAPQELEPATKIPVGIGHKIYGPILNFLPDSAVVVRLGPEQSEVLKVYDLKKEKIVGRGTITEVSRVVEELANSELIRKMKGMPSLRCEKAIGFFARLMK